MTEVMSSDDLFGEDVKPDISVRQPKVEKAAQDEEMEDLFGDDDDDVLDKAR